MELVEQSYLAHLSEDKDFSEPVTPEIQTMIAKKVARKNLFELEGLSTEGAKIIKLIFGMGRIFENLAKSFFSHAPELNQFNITGSSPDTKEFTEKLLKSSVMNLAILRSLGSKLNTPGETRGEYDYMIHPIFVPLFDYSYRRKRKISLHTNEIFQIVTDHRKAIESILHRYNVDMKIASQEMLFSFEE
jgi:hypothetical protein